MPERVVRLDSLDEVRFVLAVCRKLHPAVHLSRPGFQPSGRGLVISVLITLTRWRGHRILDGGRIALQPRVIGAVPTYLAPLGRKIGPDPALHQRLRLGGIAANAGGM